MARIICVLLGAINTATGVWMLLSPATFYLFAHIGPYNHHFIADIGAFETAIGCGLLWASRDPFVYRSLIDVALLANTLHFVNHLTDGFSETLYLQTDVALAIALLLNAYASWAARHGGLQQRPA